MKKIVCLILSLLMLFGCKEKAKETEQSNQLKVGTNAQYYPYEFKEAGELKGFDIEIAKLLAEQLGKQVVFYDMDFDALIISLQQKKVDMIIAGITITPPREKAILMIPYQGMGSSQLYFVYDSKKPLNKALTDPSLIVAAEASSYQADFIKQEFPNIQLKTLNNYADMLLELKTGKIDAIFMEPHVFTGIKPKHDSLTFTAIDIPEDKRSKGNGIGVSKDNKALAEDIQQALDSLKQSGKLQALEAIWFAGEEYE